MKKSKCEHCGKEITYTGSRPKKYCNAACRSNFRYTHDIKYMQRNTYKEQAARAKTKKLKAMELKGGSCIKCSQNHPAALCFHHIDPSTKSFSIDGRVFGNSKWEVIEKELNKCELLCFNCHQILHHGSYWDDYL